MSLNRQQVNEVAVAAIWQNSLLKRNVICKGLLRELRGLSRINWPE
jgi:hypothetical protein